MNRVLTMAASFCAGVIVALLGAVALTPAAAAPEPTAFATATAAPTRTLYPTSTATAVPTATAAPTGTPAPLPAGVECWNCSPMTARVRLSHYNPQAYNPAYPQLNCWEFSEEHDYCLSPTWIGVPWESVWNLAAACPAEWPVGTWVEIPEVGRYICLDHGERITCDQDQLCRVDLLGPGGGAWDGKEFDATLWVPTSWLLRIQEKTYE